MRRRKEATGRESRHPTRIGEASVVPISLLASARKNMTSPLSSCGVGLRSGFVEVVSPDALVRMKRVLKRTEKKVTN